MQAQKDISSYYIIGYNSGNTNLDGHYRKIDLKIKKDLAAKLDLPARIFRQQELGQIRYRGQRAATLPKL